MSKVRKKGDVILKERVFNDYRLDQLGKLLGVSREHAHDVALGKMARLWHVCNQKKTTHLDPAVVSLYVEPALIVQCELAEESDNGTLRIKGARVTVPKSGGPDPDEEAYRLSDLLAHLIGQRQPSNRSISQGRWATTRRRWAKVFDLMSRRDGRSWKDMERVLRWSQSDAFWERNILSAEKYRKQYDKLDRASREPTASRARGNVTAGDLFDFAKQLESGDDES